MTTAPPSVDMSVEAALFVRDHGGKLFVAVMRA
jgi:hypothetical protein